MKKQVARTLKIDIKKDVKPEKAPTDLQVTEDFVLGMFPGTKIIHLSRNTAINCPTLKKGDAFSVFFNTLRCCFNNHYPFAIRPEVLWYLIIHEVAQTVKLNPERYQLYFTNSDDKQTVQADIMSLNPKEWPKHINQLAGKLKEMMPSAIGDVCLQNYSTSTLESNAATAVSFMDAASPFCDYRMRLLCGLPLIRLDGHPKDYAKLVEGAKALNNLFKKDLGMYFQYLIPVLEKIASQAKGGSVDHQFWGSIYNQESGSGGPQSSDDLGGWISAFVNYIRDIEGESYSIEDCSIKLKPKPEKYYDWTKGERWLAMGMLSNHISSVDFILQQGESETKMKMIGGILGIENEDRFVSPQLSYGILETLK